MISHQYKCIFIHIPRTAGTSIEKWICGSNWWYIDKETKHLLASQAKDIYKEYWDSYYKFSFVRNPWDRMVSCLHHKDFFKLEYKEQMIIDNYKKQFGYPITIENDYRYSSRDVIYSSAPEKFRNNCVYLNILNEALDFIGKFENLPSDIAFLKEKLGIPYDFHFESKPEKSKRNEDYRVYYDEITKNTVADIYKEDIELFEYKF